MQKDGDRKTKPEIPVQMTKVRFTLKQTHVSCPAERTQFGPHTMPAYQSVAGKACQASTEP